MRQTKTQINFGVTAKLISAFVFATQIVQPLFFLYPKFKVSNNILWLYSPVCVGPDQKPLRPVFSQRGSIIACHSLLCELDVLGEVDVVDVVDGFNGFSRRILFCNV